MTEWNAEEVGRVANTSPAHPHRRRRHRGRRCPHRRGLAGRAGPGHADAPAGDNHRHTHPGPSLILVVAGTVTNCTGDDQHCTSRVYTAGDGFIDPGSGDTHMIRNEAGDPAETIAVQLLPKDAVRRLPADAPSSCPS